MCLYAPKCRYTLRPEDGVTGDCETTPTPCWELNSAPLQEMYALSTTEPSLPPQSVSGKLSC